MLNLIFSVMTYFCPTFVMTVRGAAHPPLPTPNPPPPEKKLTNALRQAILQADLSPLQ